MKEQQVLLLRYISSGVCKSKFLLHLEITLLYFVEFVHVIN